MHTATILVYIFTCTIAYITLHSPFHNFTFGGNQASQKRGHMIPWIALLSINCGPDNAIDDGNLPPGFIGWWEGEGGGTVNLRTSKVLVHPGDDIIQIVTLKVVYRDIW